MSLLESVPGVSGIVNRYFSFPGDAGVMFIDNTYVKFSGLPGGGIVEIKLPVAISVYARKRVTITENEGLVDPIKFVTPSVVTDVTLAGRAGTWRKSMMPSVPNVPVIGGTIATVTGIMGTLLGTSEYTDKIGMLRDIYINVLMAAEGPVKTEDTEGFLDGHDVTHIVPLNYQATPQLEEFAWVMHCVADADEEPLKLLFPEEE